MGFPQISDLSLSKPLLAFFDYFKGSSRIFFFSGMQNLSISCSLVCLIILVACLVVFWVGLIERQVPPVLVVSVLYILAGEYFYWRSFFDGKNGNSSFALREIYFPIARGWGLSNGSWNFHSYWSFELFSAWKSKFSFGLELQQKWKLSHCFSFVPSCFGAAIKLQVSVAWLPNYHPRVSVMHCRVH